MPRPVRVLHTLSAIAYGGVEVRHRQIANQLGQPRFDHRFIGTTGGTIAKQLCADGFDVDLLGRVESVLAPGRYVRGIQLAKSWRPDLVHGAVMEGSSLGVVIGKVLGVPMVLEETSDPQNRRPMGHRLVRTLARGATTCIAVSPAVGRYLRQDLNIAPDKVRVIVNGVSSPRQFTSSEILELRRSHGIGRSDVVIGTVSRLFDDHKRVTDLITAFGEVAADRPSLHLVIVGSGPDKALMERIAAGTGHGQRIHFVGRHVPADAYYASMDIFAIASSREAFGLVAAEAMRAGLPVVATAVGGLAEIVVDGVTGYLVPPLDPDSLARQLRRLVDGPNLRARMGEAGKQRANDRYSVERYLAQIEQLYLDLVAVGM